MDGTGIKFILKIMWIKSKTRSCWGGRWAGDVREVTALMVGLIHCTCIGVATTTTHESVDVVAEIRAKETC